MLNQRKRLIGVPPGRVDRDDERLLAYNGGPPAQESLQVRYDGWDGGRNLRGCRGRSDATVETAGDVMRRRREGERGQREEREGGEREAGEREGG